MTIDDPTTAGTAPQIEERGNILLAAPPVGVIKTIPVNQILWVLFF